MDKTTFAFFAVVVFLVSLAQPALACGGNGPRNGNTTTAPRNPPAPTAGTAQGAGMPR